MTSTVQFVHAGRQVAIHPKVVGHTVQIWIEENGKALHLHSAVSRLHVEEGLAAQQDILSVAMQAAQRDIQEGTLVLPPSYGRKLVTV